MKRMVAVLLVLAMLVPMAVMAEEETVEANIKTLLKMFVELYETDPDIFDADYIYWTYSYYQLAMAMDRLKRVQIQMDIKSNPLTGGQVVFDKNEKTVEKTSAELNMKIEKQWVSYLNGKMKAKEFAKKLIAVVKTTLND